MRLVTWLLNIDNPSSFGTIYLLSNTYLLFFFFFAVVCHIIFQALIKDPKMNSVVMNPHVKRSLKQKTFNDALAKAKVSPITVNLISEWSQTRVTAGTPVSLIVCVCGVYTCNTFEPSFVTFSKTTVH